MSNANTPTRYPKGVNTSTAGTMLYQKYGLPDPFKYIKVEDDFTSLGIDQWLVTSVATGSPTYTISDRQGGWLAILNGTADNDRTVMMMGTSANAGESFKMVAGKQTWFRTKILTADATQCDIFVGLIIATATDPVGTAPTDGIFFRKDDGDANVDFVVTKNSTATTASAIATLADSTAMELEFYYNGVDKIEYWVDGSYTGSSVVTNLPDDEELVVTIANQNGEAAAKTLEIDYILAAQER